MRKLLASVLCIAIAGSFSCSSPKKQQTPPPSLAGLEEVVQEALTTFNVPGMAIGVVADGKVILSRGYGLRDLIQKLPVTENTLFPIASCTKAFTAFLLGQLVDQGQVAWDDPVIAHLPEFRLADEETTRSLTLRDLVAHRTGLPQHDAIWFCRDMSKAEVLPCLQHLEPVCKVGEKWHYNNFMYLIAGLVIEKVTGHSWEERLHSHLLSPLEMSYSNASVEHLEQSADFSLPYAEINGVLQELSFHALDPVNPGGAINSNVLDMVKWVQLQLSEGAGLVSAKTLQEMHALQMPLAPETRDMMGVSPSGYGLGWFLGSYQGYDVVRHGGMIDGFNSEIAFIPSKNIGLVLLSNSSTDGAYAIARVRNEILDRLLDTSDASAKVALQKIHTSSHQTTPPESTNLKRPLQDYVGRYEHPAYGTVEIYLNDHQLIASYGRSTIPLEHRENDTFHGQMRELLIFGVHHLTDFAFFSDASEQIHQVGIAFEPAAKATVFNKSDCSNPN
ncbi:MAG: serine hydrolase [Verrucomicrobia bacterium]|nr:serine hydrolase [Verrucomicrobiota bacterium]